MSNSPLVQYVRWSPNHSGRRVKPIRKITIHHVAGVASVETLGAIFAPVERQASSTYGIGYDGRIGQYVDEANRPWTSGSWDNDQEAITIEVSNSAIGGQWPVSDHVLARTIELCIDICKRNGIKQLVYTGDSRGNMTLHKMFQNTSCPGPYLSSKIPYIVAEVNKQLTPPKPTPKEDDMIETAILVGSIADVATAEPLAIKLQAPIYLQGSKVMAKHLIIVGGKQPSGFTGKITNLSGRNRFETAAKVKAYLGY